MEFRDLKKQYQTLKKDIDFVVQEVMDNANFISGTQVKELEEELARYVGVKHCVTCANGTDALELALMAWDIGEGDAVFVPDFTFFSSAEVIASVGATPVFVDVCQDTFNISPKSLEQAVKAVKEEGKLTPRVIIAVDLFGLPAEFPGIREVSDRYDLKILEDGAQGFGGSIEDKRACSFGDIATTSFFPAKPLGCYGDGGGIFTDNDEICEKLQSLRVHGKGKDKYDNLYIGKNSRLDTLQAAVLKVKLQAFEQYELADVNKVAKGYDALLKDLDCVLPRIPENYQSSWAQYTILLQNQQQRDELQERLRKAGIPSMVYYKKTMHEQQAFAGIRKYVDLSVSGELCKRVLSLPMHPYLTHGEQEKIGQEVKLFLTESN